jgi:GR25 family glycosyltransferase involved in LPS biosynthesis
MLIGLPYTILPSEIDNGLLSNKVITLLTLADIFSSTYGHDVQLICMNVDGGVSPVWWNDCMHIRDKYNVVMYNDTIRVDIVIDIDCCTTPSISMQMSNSQKVIGFRYDNCMFSELEEFTYMRDTLHHMAKTGVYTEIWVWEHNVDAGHVNVLEGIYGCPVRRMPFIWTSCMLEGIASNINYMNSVNSDKSFVILGDNTGSTDNSLLPLVGLNKLECVERCHILGSNGIENSPFFQQNIQQHLHFRDTIRYTSTMRLADISDGDMILSHLRFTYILPYLTHIGWLYGNRLIHNSTILCEAGLNRGYYANNSVEEMIRAIHNMNRDDSNCSWRRELEDAWSPRRDEAVEIWQRWLSVPKREYKVSFSDMWDGFDPSCNFFLDLLRSRGLSVTVTSNGGQTDLHICGPFGYIWKSVKNTPIVFFSGERWSPPTTLDADERIQLYLTHSPDEDDHHMRLPLWILYLSGLFGDGSASISADYEGLNPRKAPLTLATHADINADAFMNRNFCAFVVSNPMNPIRNRAFEALNTYMPVSSGGAYRNTIGGPIEAYYGGGGGGELAKLAFFRRHKFCIAFENSSAPGYVTEKLLHAKMAGCIPIYWGDVTALSDFDPRGFISMCGKQPEEIVEIVQDILDDPEQCKYIASIPALGEKELSAMWKCIEKVGCALEGLLKRGQVYKESSPICNKIMDTSTMLNQQLAPLFVSYATKRFLPSIMQSLDTLQMFRTRDCPGLRYLLYTGPDVQDIDCQEIRGIGSWIEIRRLPTDVLPEGCPEDFTDFWNAQHFGWKLWILNQVVHEFLNQLIIYSDAGAQWQNMYTEMFQKAWDTGACFIIDHNTNHQWCSTEMITSMNVNDSELDGKQILGGILAVRGGDTNACRFFKESYALGLNPANLKGRKLIRILPSGQPHGHRHDQSIMSVLRLRHEYAQRFGTVEVDAATCCESLRRTHLTKRPIYLHRGNYMINHAPLPRTDDIWIINLNRRLDRILEWAKTYPALAEITQRFQAIDGRELHMTPAISDLFSKNDFIWKKSVLGCALSHILLWAQLACEGDGAKSYLILEDDMRFTCDDWENELRDALHALPQDVEVAYFGGVLPNNKPVYNDVLESVNDTWSIIKPNTLFSRTPLPIFHFCAYSYYLTQAGARKLLNALAGDMGCFTSIDHFLGHPSVGLRRYVMTVPIVGCYQESDPSYISSEFDRFDRVDTFDSDIWNNKDVFSEVEHTCGQIYGTRVSLFPVLSDVLRQTPSDIQTQRLLDPMRYSFFVAKHSQAEAEFIQGYTRILENEIRNPSAVRVWQRSNICISMKEVDCGTDIHVNVVTSLEHVERECLRAKMFYIDHESMTVEQAVSMFKKTGCIPLYVRSDGDSEFWNRLHSILPLVQLGSWEACRKFVNILIRDLRKAEVYRSGLLERVS